MTPAGYAEYNNHFLLLDKLYAMGGSGLTAVERAYALSDKERINKLKGLQLAEISDQVAEIIDNADIMYNKLQKEKDLLAAKDLQEFTDNP